MADNLTPSEVRKILGDATFAASGKAAGLVRERHFTARQADLTPLHPDTPRKNRRATNAGLILVEMDVMVKATRHERRGELEAAVTNDDRKMPWHAFGVPAKGIPQRDTIKKTCDEAEDEILEVAEQHASRELDRPIKVKRTFSI